MAEQFYVSATQETLHPTVVNEKVCWNSVSDKNCNELWSGEFFFSKNSVKINEVIDFELNISKILI